MIVGDYRTDWLALPRGDKRVVMVGSGLHSTVMKVTLDAGRQIAVKVIRRECFDIHTLAQEAEVLVMLNHPCVVKIIGWSVKSEEFVWIDELTDQELPPNPDMCDVQWDGQIRTEFAGHGSLKDVLRDRPAFWNATRQAIFITGLFLGLKYIHSKGLVHGNLNPSNLLVNERGECLIAGFGNASTPGSSPDQSRYANRESIAGSCTVESDLFAFASIVFEIVTGNPAFPPELTPLPAGRRLMDLKLPEIKNCTAFVTDVVRRCWSADLNPPSFYREALEWLETVRFAVVQHADSLEVAEYFDGIRSWEDQQAEQLRLAKEQLTV
jgi:serine/threonine protein kinase